MKIDVIYQKSCQRMTELPDESIDTILTSCPYWGLRDYGEDVKEIWGGDPDCEHNWEDTTYVRNNDQTAGLKQRSNKGSVGRDEPVQNAFCSKCGAWYGQLGLEPTLEMYIEHLLLITLECKRVLKPTGVMWWNHGDSYFTGKGSCKNPGGGNKSWKSWNDRKGIYPRGKAAPNRMSKESPPKCLALQNYRLLIRMIDEQGWILRNDVIWNKPNGMPSSVKDRLANKHEPVFCLVKNTKPQYYWNEKTALMADRKPSKAEQIEDIDWEWRECSRCMGKGRIEETICPRCKGTGKIKYSFWHGLGYWYDLDAIREPHITSAKGYVNYQEAIGKSWHNHSQDCQIGAGQKAVRCQHPSGKNPGDVWLIPTQPRPEAHFATFPDKLCIKPILATCPLEICKKCGKARVRIVENKPIFRAGKKERERNRGGRKDGFTKPADGIAGSEHTTIGWTDCGCNAGWDSGVLLDPFGGRGTAPAMAKKMSRHYIVYELKKEYCEKLIRPALEEIDPLFNWKTPSPVAG